MIRYLSDIMSVKVRFYLPGERVFCVATDSEEIQETPSEEGKVRNTYLRYGNIKSFAELLKLSEQETSSILLPTLLHLLAVFCS